MKQKKRVLSLIIGILFILAGVMLLAAGIAHEFFYFDVPQIENMLTLVAGFFDTVAFQFIPISVIPYSIFSLIIGILFLSCRKNTGFSYLKIIFYLAIEFTLFVLFAALPNNIVPPSVVARFQTINNMKIILLVVLLAEIGVLFVIYQINGWLRNRRRKKAEQEEKKSSDKGKKLTRKERKALRKQAKKDKRNKKKADPVKEEPKAVEPEIIEEKKDDYIVLPVPEDIPDLGIFRKKTPKRKLVNIKPPEEVPQQTVQPQTPSASATVESSVNYDIYSAALQNIESREQKQAEPEKPYVSEVTTFRRPTGALAEAIEKNRRELEERRRNSSSYLDSLVKENEHRQEKLVEEQTERIRQQESQIRMYDELPKTKEASMSSSVMNDIRTMQNAGYQEPVSSYAEPAPVQPEAPKYTYQEPSAPVQPEVVPAYQEPEPVRPVYSDPTPVQAAPSYQRMNVEPTRPAAVQRPVEPEPEEGDDDEVSGVGGLVSRNDRSVTEFLSRKISYQFPPEDVLKVYPRASSEIDEKTREKGNILVNTLATFRIEVTLVAIQKGPTVTMYEIVPAPGVKINSIVSLSDNLAMNLAAKQIRIVAPIPGKAAVGVEIPNDIRQVIGFREMLPALNEKKFNVPMLLGRDLFGTLKYLDLSKAPHLLIAGSTGSGKSVCVNSLICSILYNKTPREVKLIMVDPKFVELTIYNGIPHLLTPVITEPKRAIKALDFCIEEMNRRYKMLQKLSVRNIEGYNKKIVEGRYAREKMPYIVVIIDEFADLMSVTGKALEAGVGNLAAKSRAVGIHLVLATQRPSVDVITGVIKNNLPSRIAFAVTTNQDSRTILTEGGAENLLGKGDMLYSASGSPSERIQGAFLSDEEVEQIVAFVKTQGEPDYIDEAYFEEDEPKDNGYGGGDDDIETDADAPLFDQALQIAVERNGISASYLQRKLRIGYNRAARIVEEMEDAGYIGPANGSKIRPLLKYPGVE